RLLPGVTVISEEEAAKVRPETVTSAFALVDPLDGTREFIAGRDEFTINVALIENGRPVFGLVSAPALDQIWRGIVGRGAERLQLTQKQITPIHARRVDDKKLRALISRSHADEKTADWLNQYAGVELVSCGSALKFCRVAEGAADVYPRLAP